MTEVHTALQPSPLHCRYIQYNPTSLERNHNHEMLTEVDLGVPIDLILPEAYVNPDQSGRTSWVGPVSQIVWGAICVETPVWS